MVLLLTALSGIAWTIVYLDSIRVGFTQKTYAMPIAALGLNIAWEWTYAVRDLTTDPQLQGWVNLIWALADVVILTTFFRYGRSEFPAFVSRPLFVASGAVIVITSFLIQWLFIAEFGTVNIGKAAQYSAFLQNLLMSGLFIAMFVARRGRRGQTLLIAIGKWIGTLAPTILFGFIYGSFFIIGLGLLCSLFDLVYIGLLIWAKRDLSAFPTTADRPSVSQQLRNGPAEA